MRDLVLMRGSPGCGKSTFLKENKLTEYSISADDIRLLFQSPVMNHETGNMKISCKNERKVWDFLFQILEDRMIRGEFTIIDACHSKSSDFSKYSHLAEKYRYRLWCIDLSDVPLEICLEQNKNRDEYKRVSEEEIKKIYARFESNPIPNKVTTVNRENWNQIIEFNPLDCNHYEAIVFFGDIHGCFNPLNTYFTNHPFNEKTLYVFLGDYFDRGIQNKEVCQWLLDHYTYKNVMLLTGNHEEHFISYANNELDKIKSKQFLRATAVELKDFNKKDLRQLCRKFIQCAYLSFNGEEFICTHAGLGAMPKHLKFIAAHEFIKGGKYEEPIDEWFENNNENPKLYQIHGHRNILKIEMNKFGHSINLNEDIEFGGNLRILEITK